MEGEDIAPYQDEDTRLHRAWFQSNASANTSEGTGSIPEVKVLQHVIHVRILFNLMSSSLLLVILEATKHGEAVGHVGVREIVDIEGE